MTTNRYVADTYNHNRKEPTTMKRSTDRRHTRDTPPATKKFSTEQMRQQVQASAQERRGCLICMNVTDNACRRCGRRTDDPTMVQLTITPPPERGAEAPEDQFHQEWPDAQKAWPKPEA